MPLNLIGVLLVVCSWPLSRCFAEAFTAAQLVVDRGPIVAVAFDSPHNRFYVEQVVINSDAPTIHLQIKMILFSLSTQKRLAERVLETESGSTMFMPTCEAFAVDQSGQYITACFDHHVSVLRADDLTPVRSFSLPQNMSSRGMVLDEEHSEVVVLLGSDRLASPHTNAEFTLAVYDWESGVRKRAFTVSTFDGVGASEAQLAFSHESRTLVVSIPTTVRREQAARIFVCRSESTMKCTAKATIDPIGAMAFDGSGLLFSPIHPSSTQRCIPEIELTTGGKMERYCGNRYPIKQAVAVAAGSYALAFTGTSRQNPFAETTKNIQGTFALWSRQYTDRPTSINSLLNNAVGQNLVRIVGDPATAEFATFTKDGDDKITIVKIGTASAATSPIVSVAQ